MGKRGTQVAREAADMVLKDDAFQTIVVAVVQGRAIFDNIRKFILFLLSGNMGEIMIVTFALLVGAPLPLLPLQILYLNMIGDVFPALALGVGKGDQSKMKQQPRDADEPVLTRRHWAMIMGFGLLIALPVLGGFFLALHMFDMELKSAVTFSFLTLAFARLWHVFNMRDAGTRIWHNDVMRNPFVWGALVLCVLLLLLATYLPVLSGILQMAPPDAHGWTLIVGMSLIPLSVGQALKALKII
jgi:Ca2+-transporting ATPase